MDSNSLLVLVQVLAYRLTPKRFKTNGTKINYFILLTLHYVFEVNERTLFHCHTFLKEIKLQFDNVYRYF